MRPAGPGLAGVLLLDEFKAHHTEKFKNLLAELRVASDTIPGVVDSGIPSHRNVIHR